jgi:hypothetical protein
MSADLTIYCLQQVTDYVGFERLSHDVMSMVGYSTIEPLGGFKDKGRDAIHISFTDGATIFAYSVRDDWRAKLAEDAEKINRHGHTCDHLVFITTSTITAGERDEAVDSIKQLYGWTLEIYGVERLRNLLDVQFPHIKAVHPEIFPPEFLAIQHQVKQSAERDYIFISYGVDDFALASWLARKLTAEGYLVWCEKLNLIAGEEYPSDVDDALQTRVIRVIALYSQHSLNNPDISHQRAIAIGMNKQIPNFIIPLRTENISAEKLDKASRQLVFIPFENNWAEGLRLLLEKLVLLNCPKRLPNGKSIAAEAYLEKDVLSEKTETLITNYFAVEALPDSILRYGSKQAISTEIFEKLKLQWAFREVSDKLFVSFHKPPQEFIELCELRELSHGPWRGIDRLEGIDTKNLISELIRKSLLVQCIQKGLQYCPTTKLCYFPSSLTPGDRIKYLWPSGKTASISAAGERKYKVEERYRYHLAADFYVSQNLIDEFSVLLRVRVRITDRDGVPLPSRKANSRRKALCSDWWNGEWLSRMLAIVQYIADGEKITIGNEQSQQVIICSLPLSLLAPKGIDEAALDQGSYEREDMIYSFENEDDEGEDAEETRSEE